jgi:pimeloyl-ACP methyl ester carboxylesterase
LRRHEVDVGFPLVVREWGEGEQPLVFWPGLTPFGSLHLNEAGPVWAETYGIRVISVSPPGFETPALPMEEYRLPRLTELVMSLVEVLGLDRASYAGFSWGASIGCYLGASAPEWLSSVVLLDAGYQDVPRDGKSLEERIEEAKTAQGAFRFPDREAFLATAREGKADWRPALEERALEGMRQDGNELVVAAEPEAFAAALHSVITEPPTEQLVALGLTGLPVLLVTSGERAGDEEGQAAVENFAASVPQAEVVHVPESGHDLLADAPEPTIRAVGEFLSRLPL